MSKNHDQLSKEQVDGIGMPTSEPVFVGDPVVDRLLETVVALTGEVWIERDRRAVLESMLAAKGIVSADEIEQHTLSDAERASREQELSDLVARVLGPLRSVGKID